jgi:hypothetical protein
MTFRGRRALVSILCVALVAPIAGARAVRGDVGPGPPEDRGPLTPELVKALRLDPTSVRTLGVYDLRGGARVEVVYGRRAEGSECLVAVGGDGTGAGCGGLYAAGPVAILEGSTGGPELEKRSELEVVGLARPSVARVAIVDTAGRTRRPALNENHTFLVEFTQAELRARIGPAELVAYDRAGAELMRLDLAEPGS